MTKCMEEELHTTCTLAAKITVASNSVFSSDVLLRYNHRNILSLVAYSNDGPRPCLVYEYMENGSLAECLMGKVCVCEEGMGV